MYLYSHPLSCSRADKNLETARVKRQTKNICKLKLTNWSSFFSPTFVLALIRLGVNWISIRLKSFHGTKRRRICHNVIKAETETFRVDFWNSIFEHGKYQPVEASSSNELHAPSVLIWKWWSSCGWLGLSLWMVGVVWKVRRSLFKIFFNERNIY